MPRLVMMDIREIDVPGLAVQRPLYELSEKRITRAVRQALPETLWSRQCGSLVFGGPQSRAYLDGKVLHSWDGVFLPPNGWPLRLKGSLLLVPSRSA